MISPETPYLPARLSTFPVPSLASSPFGDFDPDSMGRGIAAGRGSYAPPPGYPPPLRPLRLCGEPTIVASPAELSCRRAWVMNGGPSPDCAMTTTAPIRRSQAIAVG